MQTQSAFLHRDWNTNKYWTHPVLQRWWFQRAVPQVALCALRAPFHHPPSPPSHLHRPAPREASGWHWAGRRGALGAWCLAGCSDAACWGCASWPPPTCRSAPPSLSVSGLKHKTGRGSQDRLSAAHPELPDAAAGPDLLPQEERFRRAWVSSRPTSSRKAAAPPSRV